MKDIRREIEEFNNPSTLPVIMQRLLETVSDEDASYIELSNIIEHDQSLAERVVAMANSPYFGHSGRINSLEQAVLLLGFDLVKSIALSMAVFESLSRRESRQLREFWAHSYEVALLSGLLCERIPAAGSGVCFLAGLLHDIGRVVFYMLYRNDYLPVMFEEGLIDSELEIFGVDHAVAGAWFLESALLPEEIVYPVRYHHHMNGCDRHRGVVLTVMLAEGLSSVFSERRENDGEWNDVMEQKLVDTGMNRDDFEYIESVLEQEAQRIAGFFDL